MVATSNSLHDNQVILLKRFKGKGGDAADRGRCLRQVRKQLTYLEGYRLSVLDEMERLVKYYDQIYSPPRIIHLRLLSNKNSKSLYWRMPGIRGDQPFVRLWQSDSGKQYLKSIPVHTQKMLQSVELSRLDLNTTYSIILKSTSSLRKHLDDLECLPE